MKLIGQIILFPTITTYFNTRRKITDYNISIFLFFNNHIGKDFTDQTFKITYELIPNSNKYIYLPVLISLHYVPYHHSKLVFLLYLYMIEGNRY
jgi:hypothetical protein